jgi:transketolase
MAEIMSVLFFNTMRYKVQEPKHPDSDRFILSKGHAAPGLYATWAEAGLIPVQELLNLRKFDSDLEGHPTPRLNFIDVATGSLGQGLSVAAGMAIVGKLDKSDYRVYCLLGDGESAEGSVWEALSFASTHNLDNLCAIIDVNRLGQSEPTAFQHQMDTYEARLKAFGFETYVVDGHDVQALVNAFEKAKLVKGKPQAVLAKTYKGKDFPQIEDLVDWHGKALGAKADEVLKHLESKLHSKERAPISIKAPSESKLKADISGVKLSEPPTYTLGQKIATRQAYGTALVKLGRSNDRVLAFDCDVKNSTFAITFMKEFPNRFTECFIAEQNMVGVAIGAGCRDMAIPFASTFASFFTRAFDQLRMGAISQANIKCVGSHCGVSIGEDGPSQMALEDLAMFRAIPECTVYYPSDAVSMERATELAAQNRGIAYIRTSRPATPVIYTADTPFAVGKAQIVKSNGSEDKCLLIGAGVTLFEATDAADVLKKEHNISVRVLDPFTIKPLDVCSIISNARECGSRIVVSEDHYYEGGLGDAVASAAADVGDVRVTRLAVGSVPRSGPPAFLVDKFGIGSKSIVQAVLAFVQPK